MIPPETYEEFDAYLRECFDDKNADIILNAIASHEHLKDTDITALMFQFDESAIGTYYAVEIELDCDGCDGFFVFRSAVFDGTLFYLCDAQSMPQGGASDGTMS